jgi:hypothetical protein
MIKIPFYWDFFSYFSGPRAELAKRRAGMGKNLFLLIALFGLELGVFRVDKQNLLAAAYLFKIAALLPTFE